MRLFALYSRALTAGARVSAEDAARRQQAALVRWVGHGGLNEHGGGGGSGPPDDLLALPNEVCVGGGGGGSGGCARAVQHACGYPTGVRSSLKMLLRI